MLPPSHGPGGTPGPCSHSLHSEVSFIRERMANGTAAPGTLQTGTFILFFNGCVYTLGPLCLPSFEETDLSVLEPKEAWRMPSHPSARCLPAVLLFWESNGAQGRSLTSEKEVNCLRESTLNLILLPMPSNEVVCRCTLAKAHLSRDCSKERK